MSTDGSPPAGLALFVVYDHPSDFPDNIVIRRWDIVDGVATADPERMAVVNTLDDARAILSAMNRMNLGRAPEDEAQILEVWV